MTKTVMGLGALLSLLACLALPVLHFRGVLDVGTFRGLFAAVSVAYFVTATAWESRRK